MLDALSKAFFHSLAGSRTLKRAASRYGMARPASFARRFIAGETLDEAIDAARALEARGLRLTLDQLGESVRTSDEARAATDGYLEMIHRIVEGGIERNISIKLTQLGLDIDRALCAANVRQVLDAGSPQGFFVRIDMENSPYTAATLDLFEELWREGYREVGVVLQSALYRTEQDARRMNEIGARVRLVKGAYKEPRSVAYQKKADVDAAYLRVTRVLLADGAYPAIATHDPTLVTATRRLAAERGLTADRYEFQMLYGIRRDLQAALVADGLRVRVYVPFGREWFPYFMRRLGERPANVGFVLRGVLGERRG
jgi:proline dehydrogenase